MSKWFPRSWKTKWLITLGLAYFVMKMLGIEWTEALIDVKDTKEQKRNGSRVSIFVWYLYWSVNVSKPRWLLKRVNKPEISEETSGTGRVGCPRK